jgi:hypothetical protein
MDFIAIEPSTSSAPLKWPALGLCIVTKAPGNLKSLRA